MRMVAVVGSTTIDHNRVGNRTYIQLGGVTTYAGLTYRRHGLATWVISNVAPRDEAILAPLIEAGIRLLNGDTPFTTRFVNQVRRGRRRQAVPSAAYPVPFLPITTLLNQVDCIHLGPLHPEDIAPETYERLYASNCLVVLDVQGLVRKIDRGQVAHSASRLLGPALRAASVVKADEEELDIILAAWRCGIRNIMAQCGITEWVVTAGPRGGCIYSRDGGRHHYQAEPVSSPADPTGAGDVFLATYVGARCRDHRSIAAASRLAARTAADQVAGRYIPHDLLDLSRFELAGI
jgi:sugar/nucleoside kinase (ribokinase family)